MARAYPYRAMGRSRSSGMVTTVGDAGKAWQGSVLGLSGENFRPSCDKANNVQNAIVD